MDKLGAFFEGLALATAIPASLAFGVVCFTFVWRVMRSNTPFRGVLIWTAVLMLAYVFATPAVNFWPDLAPYSRFVTRSLLLVLAYHCVRYLLTDPPNWWRFRQVEQGQRSP
jgi:hypothetical protein